MSRRRITSPGAAEPQAPRRPVDARGVRRVLTLALVLPLFATTGCGGLHDASAAEIADPAPEPRAARTPRRTAHAAATRSLLSAADTRSFRALERRLGGRSGVAVASLGSTRVERTGAWRSGAAWSSIKVPLAVTAIRRGHADPATLAAALTASDKAAAERLWASLGSGAAAARAVEATLRAGSDARTRVQARRVRAGFSAFGQTRWSLVDQARFTARLHCVPGSAQVLELMGRVVADQRWGLGRVGARFKGGWGPTRTGRYEVRQLGVVTLRGGRRVAVTIAHAPADGTFGSGTGALTTIARWAAAHFDPAGVKPRGC